MSLDQRSLFETTLLDLAIEPETAIEREKREAGAALDRIRQALVEVNRTGKLGSDYLFLQGYVQLSGPTDDFNFKHYVLTRRGLEILGFTPTPKKAVELQISYGSAVISKE